MADDGDRPRWRVELPYDVRPIMLEEEIEAEANYGVMATLLAAGVDPERIEVYRGAELATYWVVSLHDGRTAVVTDDTEAYVSWLEGPWPFKAELVGPDGVRTEIDDRILDSCAHVVAWYRDALPADDPEGSGGPDGPGDPGGLTA
jgi:hypothetical protein